MFTWTVTLDVRWRQMQPFLAPSARQVSHFDFEDDNDFNLNGTEQYQEQYQEQYLQRRSHSSQQGTVRDCSAWLSHGPPGGQIPTRRSWCITCRHLTTSDACEQERLCRHIKVKHRVTACRVPTSLSSPFIPCRHHHAHRLLFFLSRHSGSPGCQKKQVHCSWCRMERHRRKHYQCPCRWYNLPRRKVVLGWTKRTTWPTRVVCRCVYIDIMTSFHVVLTFLIINSGLNLYSSSDLANWDFEGQALSPVNNTLIGPETVVERPKIIYSEESKLWNLWFHSDNSSYGLLRQGIATSPNITGK